MDEQEKLMTVESERKRAKARLELEGDFWRVQVLVNGELIKERYFRRNAKRRALTWASEEVWLAATA